MIINRVALDKTGYFSDLICDYISEKEQVSSLYKRFPTIENFEKQITEKQRHFTQERRNVLKKSITEQYQNISISEKTQHNIGLLASKNTFTITTGHQLSLFTGPLYFIYKIVSVINMTEILKRKYPAYEFVPVYWMATEDHDFAEINHFSISQKKIVWSSSQGGAVGAFSTQGLEQVAQTLKMVFPHGKKAQNIIKLFEKSYLENQNLSCATRVLVNELFKQYGLVIVDGNDPNLKKQFIPYMQKDLFDNITESVVNRTITHIRNKNRNYSIQVNPRNINLFYLQPNSRERIVKTSQGFRVNGTSVYFSDQELLTELHQHPEKFSPNVLLRPVYQEVILPNLCYIGGAGEVAYWLQLKDLFDALQVPYPIISLRNSAVLVSEKQLNKLNKLQLDTQEIFLKNTILEHLIVKKHSQFPLDFTDQKTLLTQQFQKLYDIAQQTDYTFRNAVKAQETKQLKGLENLEKRLVKAQKRKMIDIISRVQIIRNELFPNESLQERVENFSSFVANFGEDFIDFIKRNFDPFDYSFSVIQIPFYNQNRNK